MIQFLFIFNTGNPAAFYPRTKIYADCFNQIEMMAPKAMKWRRNPRL
jgi:hypothetical protein